MKQTITIGEAHRAIEAIKLLDGTGRAGNANGVKLSMKAKLWLGINLKRLQAPVDEYVKPLFDLRAKYVNGEGKVPDPKQVAELVSLDAEITRTRIEIDLGQIELKEIEDAGCAPGTMEALGHLGGIIINDT
jgi:hypothetical protein